MYRADLTSACKWQCQTLIKLLGQVFVKHSSSTHIKPAQCVFDMCLMGVQAVPDQLASVKTRYYHRYRRESMWDV